MNTSAEATKEINVDMQLNAWREPLVATLLNLFRFEVTAQSVVDQMTGIGLWFGLTTFGFGFKGGVIASWGRICLPRAAVDFHVHGPFGGVGFEVFWFKPDRIVTATSGPEVRE